MQRAHAKLGRIGTALRAPTHRVIKSVYLHSSAASSAAVEADSHDDFKPKMKASPSDPEKLKDHVEQLLQKHKVVLFMKGTPQQPMCGFSQRVVRILHEQGVDIHGVDVLSNPVIREYMKEFSSWPTFPQLYINGDFVGGCDITTQLRESGELASLLAAPRSHSAELK